MNINYNQLQKYCKFIKTKMYNPCAMDRYKFRVIL